MTSERMEFGQRIEKFQQVLRGINLEWAILSASADLYYFCGSVQPLYLLLPGTGEPFLLARKAVTRISAEVKHIPLEVFSSGKEFSAVLERRGVLNATRIGMTFDTVSHATFLRLQKTFNAASFVDLTTAVRSLRMVKSEAEIAIQNRAAAILRQVPELVRNGFQPGMTELELSLVIENHFRRSGHTQLLRCRREGVEMSGYGICSAGIHSLAGTKFEGVCSGQGVSAAVPYGAVPLEIPRNTPVILDYAFNLEGYHVDQTRMFCWGEPGDDFRAAFEAMLKIEEAVVTMLRPGVKWDSLYEKSVTLAGEYGYEGVFMGAGTEKVRFVGHGVGLELDELPLLAEKMDQPLEEGMVIAVEPKVALPGVGIIGIEDTYVVRSAGAELLTDCPKEIIVSHR